MSDKQLQRAGISGILGGALCLFLNLMYIAAHGLDANPDHRVLLGISQDSWYALCLVPYPLLAHAFLTAMRALTSEGWSASRTLLTMALLGLCLAAAAHLVLTLPYAGDWQTAPTQRYGWLAHLFGYTTFAVCSLLGSLVARPRPAQLQLRVQIGLLGLLLLMSFAAGMLDWDYGFEFTLTPMLLFGLAWVWLGASFTRAGRRSAPLAPAWSEMSADGGQVDVVLHVGTETATPVQRRR